MAYCVSNWKKKPVNELYILWLTVNQTGQINSNSTVNFNVYCASNWTKNCKSIIYFVAYCVSNWKKKTLNELFNYLFNILWFIFNQIGPKKTCTINYIFFSLLCIKLDKNCTSIIHIMVYCKWNRTTKNCKPIIYFMVYCESNWMKNGKLVCINLDIEFYINGLCQIRRKNESQCTYN